MTNTWSTGPPRASQRGWPLRVKQRAISRVSGVKALAAELTQCGESPCRCATELMAFWSSGSMRRTESMSIVLSRRPRTASRAPPTTTMTCWTPVGSSSVATSFRYDRIWSAVMCSCTSDIQWVQVPPQAVSSHVDPATSQLWRRQLHSSLPHPGCSGAGLAMCERWDVTRPGRPSDPCVIARLLGDSGQ